MMMVTIAIRVTISIIGFISVTLVAAGLTGGKDTNRPWWNHPGKQMRLNYGE
jgi:hypothetical protein